MTPGPEFEALMREVRSGDERAAATLVRDFEPFVRRDLRFRLRDERARRLIDSMDVCQSVLASFFVRAAAGQFDLREPKDLLNLLISMARNKLAKQLQSQRRQRRDSRRTVGGVEDLALAQPLPTPSQIVSGKELLEEVSRRLDDEERRLAELRVQGQSWDEIAAALGGTAEARRKQLARAMDRVTAELRLDET